MTRRMNARLAKLEVQSRPAVVIIPKAERDALVRGHLAEGVKIEYESASNDFLAPNRAAAIEAAWRADT
jgi:hypothetical protein